MGCLKAVGIAAGSEPLHVCVFILRCCFLLLVVDCGGEGVFTEPEGDLSSPGYPNAAPLGVNCVYRVSAQPGFHITLNFSDSFHMEQVDAQGPSCLFHWLQVPH